jgi:hypothetical protein
MLNGEPEHTITPTEQYIEPFTHTACSFSLRSPRKTIDSSSSHASDDHPTARTPERHAVLAPDPHDQTCTDLVSCILAEVA